MSSMGLEHAAPATAPQEGRQQEAVETPTPSAPVPLASVPATGAPEAAATTAGPLDNLRRPTAKGPTVVQAEPADLPSLLACSDWSIRALAKDTSPDGKLMTLLKGAFESDWFKAKSCLVFDKWPAASGRPRFSHEASLDLMSALTVLRGEVHKSVMPLAQKRVKDELAKRATQLKGNTKLADRLTSEKSIAATKQVEYKGAVGADTVTSDVDVSTGGANSELGVRAYNEAFRERVGTVFDPGTVFDLNVYAMDFVHGKTDTSETSYKVNAENPEAAEPAAADSRDERQDIWALVHVARYLPDEKEWAKLVKDTVDGIGDPTEKARQQRIHDKARSIAKGFEARLQGMMEHLAGEIDAAVDALGPSAWGDDAEHYQDNALRMRAANRIYEDKLLQVKEIRAEIAALRASKADPTRLSRLVAELTDALSMAQLYANEVYGTGGGTVHAVVGMQMRKKAEAALKTKHGKDMKVKVEMTPAQWMETFTDNLGDVLKDYEHYGAHAVGGADHWYAAFKMGKYVDRMLDAIPNLADAGAMDVADRDTIQSSQDCVDLAELAQHHRTEKDGPSKNDPQQLRNHSYFKTIDAERLKGLKGSAIALGVAVRTKVGNTSAPAAEPEVVPANATPPTTPPPGAAPGSPAVVLANVLQSATRLGAEIETVEKESSDA